MVKLFNDIGIKIFVLYLPEFFLFLILIKFQFILMDQETHSVDGQQSHILLHLQLSNKNSDN